MNAFSLYLPERRDFSRWPAWHDDHRRACRHRCLSCVVGCRAPLEPHLIPAIAVTHALVEASSPEIQNQDIAAGPTMQQARAQRRWRSAKSRRSRPSRSSLPPPQPQAEVALPPKEEKVEKAGAVRIEPRGRGDFQQGDEIIRQQLLDREALEILHRASPFPAFPAAKPGTQDSFLAPVNFGH
jgi:periplasmic protein TonB